MKQEWRFGNAIALDGFPLAKDKRDAGDVRMTIEVRSSVRLCER